jgi:hypothetical protein
MCGLLDGGEVSGADWIPPPVPAAVEVA